MNLARPAAGRAGRHAEIALVDPPAGSQSAPAAAQTPVRRASFLKPGVDVALVAALVWGGDLLSAHQKQQLTERFLERAGRQVARRRRWARRCPRAVRQPVSG